MHMPAVDQHCARHENTVSKTDKPSRMCQVMQLLWRKIKHGRKRGSNLSGGRRCSFTKGIVKGLSEEVNLGKDLREMESTTQGP